MFDDQKLLQTVNRIEDQRKEEEELRNKVNIKGNKKNIESVKDAEMQFTDAEISQRILDMLLNPKIFDKIGKRTIATAGIDMTDV